MVVLICQTSQMNWPCFANMICRTFWNKTGLQVWWYKPFAPSGVSPRGKNKSPQLEPFFGCSHSDNDLNSGCLVFSNKHTLSCVDLIYICGFIWHLRRLQKCLHGTFRLNLQDHMCVCVLPNIMEMQVYPARSWTVLSFLLIFSARELFFSSAFGMNGKPNLPRAPFQLWADKLPPHLKMPSLIEQRVFFFCADLFHFASASVWLGVKFYIHLFLFIFFYSKGTNTVTVSVGITEYLLWS